MHPSDRRPWPGWKKALAQFNGLEERCSWSFLPLGQLLGARGDLPGRAPRPRQHVGLAREHRTPQRAARSKREGRAGHVHFGHLDAITVHNA